MPEQRTDWLTGRTVVIAKNRALRPNEFASTPGIVDPCGTSEFGQLLRKAAGAVDPASTCPFCPGNESATPPSEYEEVDDAAHWQVRVIPNKFPAVNLDDASNATPRVTTPSHLAASDPPAFTCGPATGAHEVIIEASRHIDRTSMLSTAELRQVLKTYAARLLHWRDDGRFVYGLVFKNQGPRAGASLSHLHSQLVALPGIPPAAEAELQTAQAAYLRTHECPYCRLLADERRAGARIVFERDGFLAFCPYASVQPHEVWLMPTEHVPSFEKFAVGEHLDRLASILHGLVARLEEVVPGPSFNLLLRTAPWKAGYDNWCHWRIELLPRVNSIAGLEFATGMYINQLAPEYAAAELRAS